jgi:hypothetical protein
MSNETVNGRGLLSGTVIKYLKNRRKTFKGISLDIEKNIPLPAFVLLSAEQWEGKFTEGDSRTRKIASNFLVNLTTSLDQAPDSDKVKNRQRADTGGPPCLPRRYHGNHYEGIR